MRIWLITVGEPLPLPGSSDRLHRTGMLAKELQRREHQVVWWASSFDHFRKRQLVEKTTSVRLAPNYALKLLRGPGYKRNVSLQRLRDHQALAREFTRLAPSEPAPEVIVCSLPILELAAAATGYGRARGIPTLVDIRDLWPDVMTDVAPTGFRWLARLALSSLYCLARKACSEATALMGVTEECVQWGTQMAGRDRTPADRPFHLGYSAVPPSDEAQARALEFWNEQGVTHEDLAFIACFFGAFGRHFELETVLRAARILAPTHPDIKLVLCGTGDELSKCRKVAADLPNVVCPGWVGEAEVWTLMRMAAAGLAPYRSTRNHVSIIPNKPGEYMSAGLPVVSSLQGVLAELLEAEDCGITYRNGDAQGLAAILQRLQGDPEYRMRLSANASRLFHRRFMAESVYREMADRVEEMAAKVATP